MSSGAQELLPPIHPGEILREEMEERGLNIARVARDLRVPSSRIDQILKGKRSISAETALRLGRYFGTSGQLWIRLQAAYDLEVAQDRLAEAIEREVLPCQSPAA